MGYGMSASLVTKPGSDDTIVRVKVATGGKDEYVDVNLSEFDPKNATAVEMFAYCEYMDAMGEGIDSKWGSFHALKRVASEDGRMDFGSLDNILNEKRDWTGMLKEAETTLHNDKTGETVSASDLLKMLEDAYKLATQKQKDKEDDWRSMSDNEWDKLLEGIDRYIDEFKERIRELIQAQNETSEEKQTTENAEISRLQEVLLTGSTKTGISKTEKVTECVSCKEGESLNLGVRYSVKGKNKYSYIRQSEKSLQRETAKAEKKARKKELKAEKRAERKAARAEAKALKDKEKILKDETKSAEQAEQAENSYLAR